MGHWSRRLAEPFLDFAGCADGVDFSDVYVEYATRHHAASAWAARGIVPT